MNLKPIAELDDVKSFLNRFAELEVDLSDVIKYYNLMGAWYADYVEQNEERNVYYEELTADNLADQNLLLLYSDIETWVDAYDEIMGALANGNCYEPTTRDYHKILSYCHNRFIRNDYVFNTVMAFVRKKRKGSFELQTLVNYLDAFAGRDDDIPTAIQVAEQKNWTWFYPPKEKSDKIPKSTVPTIPTAPWDEKTTTAPNGIDTDFMDTSVTY